MSAVTAASSDDALQSTDNATTHPVDVRSAVLTGIFLLLLIYTLHFAAPVLMPIAVAVLLNLLLSPAVRQLSRLRVPQALGARLRLACCA